MTHPVLCTSHHPDCLEAKNALRAISWEDNVTLTDEQLKSLVAKWEELRRKGMV